MKQRHELLDRLVVAQGAVRGRYQAVVSPRLQAEFAEFGGITLHQMEVVRRLLHGDEMTMHDVAMAEGIGASGATQLVDRLERRGLVVRVRDSRDRRVQRVVLTDRAKAIARRFRTAVRQAAAEIFVVMSDTEMQTYVELTERLAAAATLGERRRSA